MCRCRRKVVFCTLGLEIVVNAGALQRRPTLEVGPPSEVGPPLDVESPLEVALMWLCWCVWDTPKWGGGRILGDQEFCRQCIDLRHALFEDGAEAFKVFKACVDEMVRHLTFDIIG